MASISKDAGGCKRLLYVDGNGNRKSIRLGKITLSDAREIKTRVEIIISANTSCRGFDNTTAQWVREIPYSLAGKLAQKGLIEPREARQETSLGRFLGDFLGDFLRDVCSEMLFFRKS